MKARYNEVPKEYKRNYKKETAELLKMAAICVIAIAFIALMIVLF